MVLRFKKVHAFNYSTDDSQLVDTVSDIQIASENSLPFTFNLLILRVEALRRSHWQWLWSSVGTFFLLLLRLDLSFLNFFLEFGITLRFLAHIEFSKFLLKDVKISHYCIFVNFESEILTGKGPVLDL